VINDGRWHHLLLTKTGHDPAILNLWVDGVLEAEVTGSFVEPFGFPQNPDLTVGDFTGGTYPAIGTFDEVAIWRRTLTEEEIATVFRRGALRLQLQVRACESSTCSDSPDFLGPDGSRDTFFTDDRMPAETVVAHELTSLTGQFMQYRVVMETDTPAVSPELESVTIMGNGL
jgi:hypothetical protein